jgi:hypothetical protein
MHVLCELVRGIWWIFQSQDQNTISGFEAWLIQFGWRMAGDAALFTVKDTLEKWSFAKYWSTWFNDVLHCIFASQNKLFILSSSRVQAMLFCWKCCRLLKDSLSNQTMFYKCWWWCFYGGIWIRTHVELVIYNSARELSITTLRIWLACRTNQEGQRWCSWTSNYC